MLNTPLMGDQNAAASERELDMVDLDVGPPPPSAVDEDDGGSAGDGGGGAGAAGGGVASSSAAASRSPQATGLSVVAFVNSMSGGQEGAGIIRQLQRLRNVKQVFDLRGAIEGKWTFAEALGTYARDRSVRLVVCGGDGTVGWVLTEIDKVEHDPGALVVGVMPLGTGNDLSRCFGWGGGLRSSMVTDRHMSRLLRADVVPMDRWDIRVANSLDAGTRMPPEDLAWVPPSMQRISGGAGGAGGVESAKGGGATQSGEEGETAVAATELVAEEEGKAYEAKKSTGPDGGEESKQQQQQQQQLAAAPPAYCRELRGVFCNYFSIGVDAAIMFDFHKERKERPGRFTGRLKNKWIFATMGARHFCGEPALADHIEIEIEEGGGGSAGEEAAGAGAAGAGAGAAAGAAAGLRRASRRRPLAIPDRIQSIVLLNVQSYGGGADIFGRPPRGRPGGSGGRAAAAAAAAAGLRRRLGPADPSDGLLEIVGFYSSPGIACTICCNPCGMRAVRLGQGEAVHIRTHRRLPVQMDGEPWPQTPGEITVRLRTQSHMLKRGAKRRR
eukprot:g2789.t1